MAGTPNADRSRASNSARRRLTALALTALLFASSVVAQQAATAPARALPLKRFPDSRLTKTDAQGFYHMPTGIGDDYFDGTDNLARVRRHLRTARALGAKYLRCAFSWNGIEKKQGVYAWDFWDRLVAEAERHNIELIPYVAYTPEWAARPGEDFWKQPPRDNALFAEFMEKIAARYRGRIRSWELWNEPDLREYWQGTTAEFADLVRQGAAAVRRADPNAVIVLGGMSLGPTPFFTQLMQQHRIAAYVDIIAQHGYPESWHPQRGEAIYFGWTRDIGELIAASASGVDFWLNEIGYPDYRYSATNASKYGGTDVFYRYEHTAQYQGAYLFKSFTMALASGNASIASWYRIDDFPRTERRLGDDLIHFHLGVVDERGRPKPGFHAFQFFNRLLGVPTRPVKDAGATARRRDSKAVVNIFERKDSRIVVAAWLRSSERDEVPRHSGMLADTRFEQISVQLPCRQVPRVQFFSPFGHAISTTAKLQITPHRTSLTNIPLRGDTVFVAVAECVK